MRIRNSTDLPLALVREVLVFVAPPGVSGYSVNLTNAECSYRGSAGGGYHHVTLRIGGPAHFPRGPRPRRGPGYLPEPWLADRTEALVYLAAHELRHLWQVRVPRGRRVWGARGQMSERDADAYALRLLRAWRRRERPPAQRESRVTQSVVSERSPELNPV